MYVEGLCVCVAGCALLRVFVIYSIVLEASRKQHTPKCTRGSMLHAWQLSGAGVFEIYIRYVRAQMISVFMGILVDKKDQM